MPKRKRSLARPPEPPSRSSLFDGSSNFSISELSATQAGGDVNYSHTVQNIQVTINQQSPFHLQTFAAGALAGSAMTVGLFGTPDHSLL
ncbi:hypothetical protein DFP72DRAFT_1168047 [Ephemerocybe angulata]|uniref:Uncharacterized protein n=1 Tax=Ephemerocybe angulata TaxID=980116 RepID=A0A8H6I2H3_9AGAR|nr:hypothetical protein DFP72DRAFT_1168047 [Tulosesus angulatus]